MARATVRSWSAASPRTIKPPTAPQPKPSTDSCIPVRPKTRNSIAVPSLGALPWRARFVEPIMAAAAFAAQGWMSCFGGKPAAKPAHSEQLSVPNGGFGKFHSKRLPLIVMQVRVCEASPVFPESDAKAAGRANVRSAQGEDRAPPTVAARITRQPVTH
jgi:hypothetical protein